MSDGLKDIHVSLANWLASVLGTLRAGLSVPISTSHDPDIGTPTTDPDFDRWLHNDPMVTGNSAIRYGDDAPGYLTGNGLGSLEIGAADD